MIQQYTDKPQPQAQEVTVTKEQKPGAQTVSAHFLKFTIRFFTLAKSQYQQQNVVKANTLAFNALMRLNELSGRNLTMSELADQLDITKQQLTKLVNDLEEKELVQRTHDSRNRRQVYIHITDQGARMLTDLKQSMLDSTLKALSCYTEEELAKLDHCLTNLSELLEKFNTES